MTEKVYLAPTSLTSLDAEGSGGEALATHLGVGSPSSWPPAHNDADTRVWMRSLIEDFPSETGFAGWYIIAGDRLVGNCGFKGPPDDQGHVEIGYAVLAADQRRGIATKAARLLIEQAFADTRVTAVLAETLADNPRSQAVLRKCGFVATGERDDPDDGPVATFALPRESARLAPVHSSA
jgi:[ribosomal protein S5]-alanine N-acetyltransferase